MFEAKFLVCSKSPLSADVCKDSVKEVRERPSPFVSNSNSSRESYPDDISPITRDLYRLLLCSVELEALGTLRNETEMQNRVVVQGNRKTAQKLQIILLKNKMLSPFSILSRSHVVDKPYLYTYILGLFRTITTHDLHEDWPLNFLDQGSGSYK